MGESSSNSWIKISGCTISSSEVGKPWSVWSWGRKDIGSLNYGNEQEKLKNWFSSLVEG